MFRDIQNLKIIPGDDATARRKIFWNKFKFGRDRWDEVRYVGFHTLDRESGEQLEKQLYASAGVPLEKKWSNFYVQRDYPREETLAKKLNLPEQYAFVHDDSRYKIDDSRITSDIFLFRPKKDLTENIFDYCGIIERASEIHVIDSSFMFLIDCLPLKKQGQKLFVHRYVRQDNPSWVLPILRKDWFILT